MIERLFLDRVDTESTRSPVGREYDRVVESASYEAETALTFPQPTEAGTEITLDAAIFDPMPIPRRDDARISDDLDIHVCFLSPLILEALLTATSEG